MSSPRKRVRLFKQRVLDVASDAGYASIVSRTDKKTYKCTHVSCAGTIEHMYLSYFLVEYSYYRKCNRRNCLVHSDDCVLCTG